METLADYERQAEESLSERARVYFKAGGQVTLTDNQAAFKRWRLFPRTLVDIPRRDVSTTILGHHVTFPVCVAPTAMHVLAHPDGEVATAKGTASMGTVFTLSNMSNCSLEEVSDSASDGLKFFQLNLFWKREVILDLVRRVERCGYKALVISVDTSFHKRRLKSKGDQLRLGSLEAYREHSTSSDYWQEIARGLDGPALMIQDIEWLKGITTLPIILKGILSVHDAAKAVDLGVAGILVSNHGARTVDTTPATIDVVEPIVRVASGQCEVYLDGGVRSGSDVLKALALGARAVFLGRPVIHGLACDGEEGVKRVLQIMKEEFELAMAFCGCADVSCIDRSLVQHQSEFPAV